MRLFKNIINVINRTLGAFLLGVGTARIILKDYKGAAYILIVVSVLFATGYFTNIYCRYDR